MIRFIDLRGQVYNDDDLPKEKQKMIFAFFDTCTDLFIDFNGSYVWESRADFVWDYRKEVKEKHEFERFDSKIQVYIKCKINKQGKKNGK